METSLPAVSTKPFHQRHKHLLLIPASCLGGLVAGHWMPPGWQSQVVANTAFGLCMGLLLACGFSLVKSYRKEVRAASLKRNLPVLVLAAGAILVFERLDVRANKVLLDELVIQASAIQLLETNEYRIPAYSHNLLNEFWSFPGIPDKRPPFSPFLLSMMHRLTGYHQGNGYVVNAVLGFVLLVLIGKVGQACHPRHGASLAILSFASIPLLSQNITSQHFEILYATQIAFLLYTSLRIVLRGKSEELPLAYLLAATIAMTRYEGLLFYIVPFLVHWRVITQDKPEGNLGMVYLLCPLNVAFIFTLLGHVGQNPNFWQLEDLQSSSPFGPMYWMQNTGAFFDFMLETTRALPNSLPLAVLGLASLPIAVIHFGKGAVQLARPAGNADPVLLPLFAVFVTFLLFLGLIFSYHWGFVNTDTTSRFLVFPFLLLTVTYLYALKVEPFWLFLIAILLAGAGGVQSAFVDGNPPGFSYFLVIAGLLAGAVCSLKKPWASRTTPILLLFWGTYLVAETLPAIAQRNYESDYIPMRRTEVFLEWIQEKAGTNSVFIAESPFYGMVCRESSTTFERFNGQPEVLVNLLKTRRFRAIYALQSVVIDEEGNLHPEDKWRLSDRISWETVKFKRLNVNAGVRIVEITGIEEPADPPASQPQ